MNNKSSSFLILLCLMASYMPLKGYAFNYAKAKVTIKVVDDYGEPVKGAKVILGFSSFGEKSTGCRGGTDSKGLFSGSARTHGEFSWVISKDRYYETTGVDEKWMRHRTGNIKNGKWQPWNPTIEVVLKKIENPVPMYAKIMELEMPEDNKPIGFDLNKGDWVSPYGNGIIKDFIFTINKKGKNFDAFEINLQLNFSNLGDGIQQFTRSHSGYGSELKLPKEAPLNEYNDQWRKKMGNTPNLGRYNLKDRDDIGFIFRVRTILDENGNIIKANYGKIQKDIKVVGYLADHPILLFTYYFNPDGTRNLEFDPKQNLFKKLTSLESPNMP